MKRRCRLRRGQEEAHRFNDGVRATIDPCSTKTSGAGRSRRASWSRSSSSRSPSRFVPFAESVDFTVLNIFLLMFFLAALFVISAANLNAEGEAFDDEQRPELGAIAKLPIKPPEELPILQKFEKKEGLGRDRAEAQGRRRPDGQEGTPPALGASRGPGRATRTTSDQARFPVAKVFGVRAWRHLHHLGHQGNGGELKSAKGMPRRGGGDPAALVVLVCVARARVAAASATRSASAASAPSGSWRWQPAVTGPALACSAARKTSTSASPRLTRWSWARSTRNHSSKVIHANRGQIRYLLREPAEPVPRS